MSEATPTGYHFASGTASHTHAYLFPEVEKALAALAWPTGEKRIFEVGCGNGATAAALTRLGYQVTGVDPSVEGIQIANREYPEVRLEPGSCYDDLAGKYGRFPAVVSLEVVENVFHPRKYAKGVYDLLEPGGTALISTPYHGYWKNLALAISGKMDAHFTALWD